MACRIQTHVTQVLPKGRQRATRDKNGLTPAELEAVTPGIPQCLTQKMGQQEGELSEGDALMADHYVAAARNEIVRLRLLKLKNAPAEPRDVPYVKESISTEYDEGEEAED